jgi:hypothetical protein
VQDEVSLETLNSTTKSDSGQDWIPPKDRVLSTKVSTIWDLLILRSKGEKGSTLICRSHSRGLRHKVL